MDDCKTPTFAFRGKRMHKVLVWFAIFIMTGYANVLPSAVPYSDLPEYIHDPNIPFKTADSYEQALQIWKTPEDINAWIAANFSYDMARAMRFSETQRAKNEPFLIYQPAELFKTKAGVCIDLSRFGVETLRRIDPQSDPKYLMIEFNPIQIKGNTFRLHWLVSFKRDHSCPK